MQQNPTKLLNEIIASLRLIPKSYHVPLAGMALLVVGLIAAVLAVEASDDTTKITYTKGDVALEAPIKPPAPKDAVRDLFDPSTGQTAAQQRESAVHSQIDNILLNSYVLMRCKKLSQAEYQDTYQMLINYVIAQQLAATRDAADAIVRERAKAANASYEMIYGRLKCGEIDGKGLAYSLEVWRSNMRLAPIRQQTPNLPAPATQP